MPEGGFCSFKVCFHVFLCLGEQVTSVPKESSAPSEEIKVQEGHKFMISWHLFLAVPHRACPRGVRAERP